MNGYDIDLFSELTGLDLSECQLATFERAMKRAISFLENELGWTFDYESKYEELGKVKSVCSCPKFLNKIDAESMIPADEVIGKIKLFPYDKKMSSLPIDPATNIYRVKLAVPMSGDGYKFITVKDLDNVMQRPLSKSQEVIRYIERCDTWPYNCGCECPNCSVLAIDANWLSEIPKELYEIFTELILYFMKHPYSLDVVRTIKSESVDGHSVSYDKDETLENITDSDKYKLLIKNFIGPYSPYYRSVKFY